MPDTPSEKREANEKIPKKGKLDKYKYYIIGGLALLAVLVFYFTSKSKQNASGTAGTSSLAAMGIDPATGVPYAQEYANSYGSGMGSLGYGGGGFTGPAGKSGPRGHTGKRGHTGRRGKTGPRGRKPKPKKKSVMSASANNASARKSWNSRIVPAANQHSIK